MYENYWQLERRPFETTDDPRFYYPGESHQGTLLKLRYVIENRRGGAILAGASGVGKTLLVRLLSKQLAEAFRPIAHLVFPQMTAVELLAYLAEELMAPAGTVGPISASVDQIIRRLQSFLLDNEAQGRHAVVVIDEAHLIEDVATLEALRLLLNLTSSGKPLLTLLLVGQPKLLPIIDRMPEMEERLAIKCLLRPLNLEETISYVNHRMQAAGAKRTIFEPESLETLHNLTHGLSRRINRLCDLALLIGFAEERKTISSAQLEAVSQELVTVTAD